MKKKLLFLVIPVVCIGLILSFNGKKDNDTFENITQNSGETFSHLLGKDGNQEMKEEMEREMEESREVEEQENKKSIPHSEYFRMWDEAIYTACRKLLNEIKVSERIK